jgi:hypothetical protein
MKGSTVERVGEINGKKVEIKCSRNEGIEVNGDRDEREQGRRRQR